MSDYNEHLISMAGGDGPEKLVDLNMHVITPDNMVETLSFTNLPMSRVKDAIDLLNDDHVELIPEPPVHDRIWQVPNPHRTKDFTSRELFGNQIGEERNGRIIKECLECGALVTKHGHHTIWHNKLLP